MLRRKTAKAGAASIDDDAQLRRMVDSLRGSVGTAEYKHLLPGLLFLKYINDAFEEQRAELLADVSEGADPENPDEYRAKNVFWVLPESRWSYLSVHAKQPIIGQLIDRAMEAIERDNKALRDVLPKDYSRPYLDQTRLGKLIKLIDDIQVGGTEAIAKDVLGRVYEYFLSRFAKSGGRKGGEFYTPRCVVKLLVEMLEPFRGQVYDPCCGSGGMFVQSVEFIKTHTNGSGRAVETKADVNIFGQELNHTTWRLAKMNLAMRGIDGHIAYGDTLHNDCFPDLKADFILANSPFNMRDWGAEHLKGDKRWKYGIPPARNANFAWMQHRAPPGAYGYGWRCDGQQLDVF